MNDVYANTKAIFSPFPFFPSSFPFPCIDTKTKLTPLTQNRRRSRFFIVRFHSPVWEIAQPRGARGELEEATTPRSRSRDLDPRMRRDSVRVTGHAKFTRGPILARSELWLNAFHRLEKESPRVSYCRSAEKSREIKSR